jgi:hypothetical protein
MATYQFVPRQTSAVSLPQPSRSSYELRSPHHTFSYPQQKIILLHSGIWPFFLALALAMAFFAATLRACCPTWKGKKSGPHIPHLALFRFDIRRRISHIHPGRRRPWGETVLAFESNESNVSQIKRGLGKSNDPPV